MIDYTFKIIATFSRGQSVKCYWTQFLVPLWACWVEIDGLLQIQSSAVITWSIQGSDQFISFNSIPIQVGFGIFQFNSIPIQIGFRIFQFNSNSIHFLSIPIQFNSIFMHHNKQINQLIEYFKFNLNISLFAAQFRKYIILDHNNSRINKSALVQVLG